MIGSYRKEKVLGKGGFGKVYLCRHKSQLYAVKEILKAKTNVAKAVMEAGIMKKLNHLDHFVHCHDVLEDRNAIYIVMQYFPDGTLHDLVVKNGKGLTENEANKYLAQLIDGVKKLHELGLMHRDLKPSNILIRKQIIADFGLSKLALVGSTACGTPCYMAPEILTRRHDKAVDVYSLGAIYYFMINGNHPYFKFDECGYPIFPNKPKERGHRCLTGRMMCQRKDERLSLDQIKFENGGFALSRGSCAKCGLYLFYASKAEKDALNASADKKFGLFYGSFLASGVLAAFIPAAAPILAPVAIVVGCGSLCSGIYDAYKLGRHENFDGVAKICDEFREDNDYHWIRTGLMD